MARKTRATDETVKDIFAKNLTEIMGKRGENQTSLAEKIRIGYEAGVFKEKISRQTISNYMLGINKPTAENLVILCKVLHVSSDYLLFHESNNHYAENPFKLHDLVENHSDLFDMLLAAQEDEYKNGKNYDLMGLIELYIFHKKTKGVFVLTNSGEVKLAKTKADADRVGFMNADFVNQLDADEITKATFMKIIEDALNNLREYSLTF